MNPSLAGWIRKTVRAKPASPGLGGKDFTRFDFGGVVKVTVDPSRYGEPRGHYVPPNVRSSRPCAKVLTHPKADPIIATAILLHEIGHMICASESGTPRLDSGEDFAVEVRAWRWARRQWRSVEPRHRFPADVEFKSLATYR